MVRDQRSWLRLTHIPTGTVVKLFAAWPRNHWKWIAWADGMARKLLLAKLHRPVPGPSFRRSYHLNPPLGIEPFIHEDGGASLHGAEVVARVLDGDFDQLLLARCRFSPPAARRACP